MPTDRGAARADADDLARTDADVRAADGRDGRVAREAAKQQRQTEAVVLTDPNGIECGRCGMIRRDRDPTAAEAARCPKCKAFAVFRVVITECPLKGDDAECHDRHHHAARGDHVMSVTP